MQNKKVEKNSSHEFAFYYQGLSEILSKDIDITIVCDELFHRFKHVLKMKADDRCIIFNQKERVTFIFGSLQGKNKIVGTYQNRQLNSSLQPEITFLLPLLKIDALSEAVYALAEVGINNIQLISTVKTQTPCNDKLLDKLHRVVVAAAEQSKMFAFPIIIPAVTLEAWLEQSRPGLKFHFDVGGVSAQEWYQPVQHNQNYYLLVGPEGDLTDAEKLSVKQAGFQTCLLTSTILRSVRSVSLVSGMFRL
ncbi:RsmE family RNA methyltransferase [Candidatus Babeliales bacterium]|nr:RsmE family RNA methyltransferase [Candidatus Babeliales bacterium]MBP9844074.1 RsmE family RNA methyltransferase [Candidatus Babeliales bacterium]